MVPLHAVHYQDYWKKHTAMVPFYGKFRAHHVGENRNLASAVANITLETNLFQHLSFLTSTLQRVFNSDPPKTISQTHPSTTMTLDNGLQLTSGSFALRKICLQKTKCCKNWMNNRKINTEKAETMTLLLLLPKVVYNHITTFLTISPTVLVLGPKWLASPAWEDSPRLAMTSPCRMAAKRPVAAPGPHFSPVRGHAGNKIIIITGVQWATETRSICIIPTQSQATEFVHPLLQFHAEQLQCFSLWFHLQRSSNDSMFRSPASFQ